MAAQRSIILIDGSNFYFKLKALGLQHLLAFDFSSFVDYLGRGTVVLQTEYFVGAIRTDGSETTQRLFNNQRRLLAHLQQHHVVYSLGYLLKSNGRFHEKGVDVNIAVMMLVAAYEDVCDRIVLVSSDTDLLPAVKKARERGKLVEYIGFSHQPSVAMVANCSISRLLTKEELLRVVPEHKETPHAA